MPVIINITKHTKVQIVHNHRNSFLEKRPVLRADLFRLIYIVNTGWDLPATIRRNF